MKILYVITSTHTGGAEKALAALVVQTVQENQVKVSQEQKLLLVAVVW